MPLNWNDFFLREGIKQNSCRNHSPALDRLLHPSMCLVTAATLKGKEKNKNKPELYIDRQSNGRQREVKSRGRHAVFLYKE